MSTSPDQGPLALFDLYLRILSDSYLTFLQERRKIEETYYESLFELHRKVLNVDQFFNSHLGFTTLRSAWSGVRDNVEREARTRRAFMESMTREMINPLIYLKETQERIRGRIRNKMKESASAHDVYAEYMLPKLKHAYLEKCQDVENSVVLSAASHTKSNLRHTDAQGQHHRDPAAWPVLASPRPPNALERRLSMGASGILQISLPSTSLSDLISQSNTFMPILTHPPGMRQLNQPMTFLDKGDAGEVPGGGLDRDLRSVQAKREADEADLQYRNAVRWCETLRLNREMTMQAGYDVGVYQQVMHIVDLTFSKSLETSIRESSEIVKKVLGRYADNLTTLFSTGLQLASHGAQQVEKVSIDRDMKGVNTWIAQSLASSAPTPIRYFNFYVGECKDMIFGFSLQDYAMARDLPKGEIPRVVRVCIEEVDKRGLYVEGIYQTRPEAMSPLSCLPLLGCQVLDRGTPVNELRYRIERNEEAFCFNPTDDIHAIASLLKMYLRELPEPLFEFSLEDKTQHTVNPENHFASDFQLVRTKIRRLPPIHRYTLEAVLLHLNRVALRCERNKMNARDLAIAFGTLSNDDEPGYNDTLVETLIIHSPALFSNRNKLTSFPLPSSHHPTPVGKVPPPLAYGSAKARLTGYDLQQRINAPLPQIPIPQTSTGDDFKPQPPPRPPAAVHPSRGNRGGTNELFNKSPTRPEAENDVTSPTSYISSPQLPLNPGEKGAPTPIQNFRETKGLDFSQQETFEGERTRPAPASPQSSDPPAPSPSGYKFSQTPPTTLSSILPQPTFTLQRQQHPVTTKILTQKQPQPEARYPTSLLTIDSTLVGDFESICGSFETPPSSPPPIHHHVVFAQTSITTKTSQVSLNNSPNSGRSSSPSAVMSSSSRPLPIPGKDKKPNGGRSKPLDTGPASGSSGGVSSPSVSTMSNSLSTVEESSDSPLQPPVTSSGPVTSSSSTASPFIFQQLLNGVSFGFNPPQISTVKTTPKGGVPNVISLRAGVFVPFHIQAPDWRHLLQLMAGLSWTRIEAPIKALAAAEQGLKLRIVVQFVKANTTSLDWTTIIYLTIDNPPPSNAPQKFTDGDVNTLPFSYTASPLPLLLCGGPDTSCSKYYTIPATQNTPYPTLPISFPNMAMYLASAVEDSRRMAHDNSSGMKRLAKMLDMIYPAEI